MFFQSYDSFKIMVGLPTTGGAPPPDVKVKTAIKDTVDDLRKKF